MTEATFWTSTSKRDLADGAPRGDAPHDGASARSQIALAVCVAMAVVLLAFLVLPTGHQHHMKPARFSSLFATVNEGTPVAVSRTELSLLAAHLEIPVYWAGSQAGHTLKFRTTRYGGVVLIYLSAATPLLTKVRTWLTVVTDPYESDPYAQLVKDATGRGYNLYIRPGGKFVLALPNGKEAYFASPNSHLLVEVYDPSKGVALREVFSGRVRPVD